ncbi:Na(+) H(+) antiporter subunit B [Staphylococcus aureus]|nr:Na(+) H(+) antiporter subunit B [Staphylococcus aureus]
MKENDVVLRTVTKLVVFILLTFGFYVFFAGHNILVVGLLVV